MKIMSRNINGIRAALKKGFLDVIENEAPDILCVQEVRAFEDQMPGEMAGLLADYDYSRNAATKPGYAGTATFCKKHLDILHHDHFEQKGLFSQDGRVIETTINGEQPIVLLNVYFPNGNPRANGQEMLSRKLEFYDELHARADELRAQGHHVICAGDFNVAHTEIDLASPKTNKRSIGFLPEERAKLDAMIAAGYMDVLRHFAPDEPGHYSRRSYRKDAKANNKGWRYDYFFVCPKMLQRVQHMEHLRDVDSSDHCPLILVLG